MRDSRKSSAPRQKQAGQNPFVSQIPSSPVAPLAPFRFGLVLASGIALSLTGGCASTSSSAAPVSVAELLSSAAPQPLSAEERASDGDGASSAPSTLPGGVRVSADQVWTAPDQSLRVLVRAVVASSLCPPGARCVWAGEAAHVVVEVEAAPFDNAADPAPNANAEPSPNAEVLRLFVGQPQTFAGWSLEAANISPPTAVLLLNPQNEPAEGE